MSCFWKCPVTGLPLPRRSAHPIQRPPPQMPSPAAKGASGVRLPPGGGVLAFTVRVEWWPTVMLAIQYSCRLCHSLKIFSGSHQQHTAHRVPSFSAAAAAAPAAEGPVQPFPLDPPPPVRHCFLPQPIRRPPRPPEAAARCAPGRGRWSGGQRANALSSGGASKFWLMKETPPFSSKQALRMTIPFTLTQKHR